MIIETKNFGNGFSIPVFGIGTWMMGGAFERDPNNDDNLDVQAIKFAISRGVSHIDTAEKYAAGFAEKIVSNAIKGFDRSRLFITSKVWKTNLGYDDLIKAARASLNRLEIEYLDLYFIHWPNGTIPLRETMSAMDALVYDGLVRNIGVSNFTVAQINEAQSYTKNRIVAAQMHYNLAFREPEENGMLEYCQKFDIALISWRPLRDLLSNVYREPVIEQMCQKYRKTAVQIAINWLISQPNVVTISGMRTREHLEENLGALNWRMGDDDIQLLREKVPIVRQYREY